MRTLEHNNAGDDSAIDAMVRLLQRVTEPGDARGTIARFFEAYGQIRAVEHFVGVVPVAGRPEAYRVLYSVSAKQMEHEVSCDMSMAALEHLPICEGGVIPHLLRAGRPRMVVDLDLSGDLVLRDLAGLNCAMVLPIFVGDRIDEWTIGFSRGEPPFAVRGEDVAQAALTANLLGVVLRNYDQGEEVRELNKRLRDQLDQIARVQQSLLPNRLPDIPGLEIATSYLTSNEAGGDYYDFFRLPNGKWGIVIADVSGHGAAAATIMAMLHAILHCYAPVNPGTVIDPALVNRFANERLVEAGLEGNFITSFLAVFDPATGEFIYSNAGHPPPRVKNGRDGHVWPVEGASSLPLGILEGVEYETARVHLHPGDTLVLFTDGITEAFSPTREMYGDARLEESLRSCSGMPDCVVESVHTTLFAHRGAATRDDDQTLVAIRYRGGKAHVDAATLNGALVGAL